MHALSTIRSPRARGEAFFLVRAPLRAYFCCEHPANFHCERFDRRVHAACTPRARGEQMGHFFFTWVSDHFQAFWKFDLFDLDDPISDLNYQNFQFRVENPSTYYQLNSFCSWYQKLIHKYTREITFMEIVSFWINKKIDFLLRKMHYPRIKDMFNCMDNMSESINETNLAVANVLLDACSSFLKLSKITKIEY